MGRDRPSATYSAGGADEALLSYCARLGVSAAGDESLENEHVFVPLGSSVRGDGDSGDGRVRNGDGDGDEKCDEENSNAEREDAHAHIDSSVEYRPPLPVRRVAPELQSLVRSRPLNGSTAYNRSKAEGSTQGWTKRLVAKRSSKAVTSNATTRLQKSRGSAALGKLRSSKLDLTEDLSRPDA